MSSHRVRRFAAQEALALLFANDDSATDVSDEEEAYVDNHEEEALTGHELQREESVEVTDGDAVEYFMSESSEDSNSSDDEIIFEGGDIAFSSLPFESRRRERNIVTESAANLSHPQNEREAFQLFINESMIRTIQRHTNRKAADCRRARNPTRRRSHHSDFSYDEICAGIALVLRAGCDRDNLTSLDDLWSSIEGRPFYKSVMSRSRFKFFLRVIRFDNYRTRMDRQRDDKLAAFSEVWNAFGQNLTKHYIPKAVLTVDEQLVGYRGRAPGRTYLPSKPRKYGIKIFWLAEADSGFALKGKIYTGREESGVHRNLGRDIVVELTQPYHGTNREVVTDNYFTSHQLACDLLDRGLTLLGTLRNHRREIPAQLRNKKRPVNSSLFVHDHNRKIVLVSYIPKKNKNVTLLSSSHSGEQRQGPDNKPALIFDYNVGKKGVDQLDQNVEEYTCRRKTVRWPLLLFFNILDIAAYNGYLLMKFDNDKVNRKDFLRNLTFQLAFPHTRRRFALNPRLSRNVRSAALLLGFLSSEEPLHVDRQHGSKLSRCHACGKVTRSICDACQTAVCPMHRKITKSCVCFLCK